MKCPLCGAPTDIKDTRKKDGNVIQRRRLCFNNHFFRTEERSISEPKLKKSRFKE